MEKPIIRHRVPESDPVYKREREFLREKYQEHPFGDSAVATYEYLTKNRGKLRRLFDPPGNFLQSDFKALAENYCELFERGDYKGDVVHLSNVLGKMLDPQKMSGKFKKQFGADPREAMQKVLLHLRKGGSLPDEFLYKAAKRHLEDFREQEARLQEVAERTKVEFKDAVTKAAADGQLPDEAVRALSRTDAIEARLFDSLLRLGSPVGGFVRGFGRVGISDTLLQPELAPRLRAVLFHEFLHELSGKSVTIESRIDAEDRDRIIRHIYDRKSGVGLHSPHLHHSSNAWLNEAVTERLALQLSGYEKDTGKFAYKGSSSYSEERRELDRLLAAGLDEQTVADAYFENLTPDSPREGREYSFTKLLRSIRAIEGPQGFARLENKFIMLEIERELEFFYIQPVTGEVSRNNLSPAVDVFAITITVGNSETTRLAKKCIWVGASERAKNNPVEYGIVGVRSMLADIESYYGKRVRCEVVAI